MYEIIPTVQWHRPGLVIIWPMWDSERGEEREAARCGRIGALPAPITATFPSGQGRVGAIRRVTAGSAGQSSSGVGNIGMSPASGATYSKMAVPISPFDR